MRKLLLALPVLGLAACGDGVAGEVAEAPAAPPKVAQVAKKDKNGYVVYERKGVIYAEPVRTRGGSPSRDQVLRLPGLPGDGDTGF